MSTQEEVEVSYDVSNDFFQLWLDESMSYTCALYETGDETLEQAQHQKHVWHAKAGKMDSDSRILDIGCGWGSAIEHFIRDTGVREAVGITLSRSQHAEAVRRQIPRAEFHVCDFRDFQPTEKFDAVVSLCMMEHIATPEEVREGRHIDAYRDYFKKAHSWTKPGAHFALQTILRNRVPRIKQDLIDINWLTYAIFPGGLSLRLEDVVKAVNPYWEIMKIRVDRLDYKRTCAEWLQRMRDHETQIRQQWGDQVFDDYDRYLRTCVRGFEMHYQSLARYELRRID